MNGALENLALSIPAVMAITTILFAISDYSSTHKPVNQANLDDKVKVNHFTDESWLYSVIGLQFIAYNQQLLRHPEQYELILSIARYDLYRFANYSCEVDQLINLLAICWIYDPLQKEQSPDPLYKNPFSIANLNLSHLFSVGVRPKEFLSFHEEIDNLDYGEVLKKWAHGMQDLVRNLNDGGSGYVVYGYYQRRVELLVTVMHTFDKIVTLADFSD